MSDWQSMAQFSGHLDSPPPSMDVRVEFAARTRQGPRRPVNDDHYLVLRLARHQQTLMTSLPDHEVPARFDEFAYGMVIADGLGEEGEAASRLAITTLMHLAVYFGKWQVRIDERAAYDVMRRAERFYKSVDSALVKAGRDRPGGLETTLTVVYTAGDQLFVAHSGNTRAYLCRDGELFALTHDHVSAGQRVAKAPFVEFAGAPDLHQALTNALGAQDTRGPRIDVDRCGLLDGDAVLLCTDGLFAAVDEAHIACVLKDRGTAEAHCEALMNLAAAGGAEDNATAVVAQYRVAEAPTQGL